MKLFDLKHIEGFYWRNGKITWSWRVDQILAYTEYSVYADMYIYKHNQNE
jgi:hypothetical protein